MKDPEFESFADGIESHFRARRGAEHRLSPRDFNLARSWYELGIPLATVLVAIDRAFEGGDVTSLAFCRRRVEELAASGNRPIVRPTPPTEKLSLGDVTSILADLHTRLLGLKPGPAACFEPPLRKIQEVQDLLAVSARPNWDYLRRKLLEIDSDVSAALLSALSEQELESSQTEATVAVERHRGHVTDAALEDA